MTQNERLSALIEGFIEENTEYVGMKIPKEKVAQEDLLRSLMNVRPAGKLSAELLTIQNDYLQEAIRAKGITDSASLTMIKPHIYLWQGDITTLKCDAIVNAANSRLTGCYIPNHRCIDNAIHTFAGVELRYECDRLMREQGYDEPTGRAKLTPAYNLPCRYILHTVGPIITDELTANDRALLASSYQSCLELAETYQLTSLAFCCISTGEFRFPNDIAAQIAIATVEKFLEQSTHVKKVIFNVFKDIDLAIYRQLLCGN